MKLVVNMTIETALKLGCKFAKLVSVDNLPSGFNSKVPCFVFPDNTFFVPIANQPMIWPIDEKLLCEYH